MWKKLRSVFLFALITGALLACPAIADDDAMMDVDDSSFTGVVGTWGTSAVVPCAEGGSYKYAWGPSQVMTLETAQLADITGEYAVYARWTAHPNRNDSVTYRIYDGATLRSTRNGVNQQTHGCEWNYLATVNLTSGNKGRVEVDSTAAALPAEATTVDAVRFVRVSKDKNDTVDEAGMEYSQSTGSTTITATSTASPQTLRSDSIICPNSGYVVALATGELSWTPTGANNWAQVSHCLSTSTAWTASYTQSHARVANDTDSGSWRREAMVNQRVTSCSAGETVNVYWLIVREADINVDSYVYHPVLTLMYFPTSY